MSYYDKIRNHYDNVGVAKFYMSHVLKPGERGEFMRSLDKDTKERYNRGQPFIDSDWDEIKKALYVLDSPLMEALK